MQSRKLLIVFYGDGKGKTSAALGMILRAIGHDLKVAIFQFVKQDLNVGEYRTLKTLPNVIYVTLGLGMRADVKEHREYTLSKLPQVRDIVSRERPFLVVYDELGVAVHKNILTLEEALQLIDYTLQYSHVVVTGKYMPAEIVEKADLATEFKCIKHYYRTTGMTFPGLDY